MDHQNDKFFTIWYGVYNQVKRQLIYSSAGHPPAILLSQPTWGKATATLLKTSSMPIGMLPDTRFVNQRCTIDPASVLYIFSDGVYEIMQPDGNVWGLDAFTNLLIKDQRSISQFGLDYILKQIKKIQPKDSLDDDLSLLQINFS
jgi:sigma-B regulation protein RsbU (phosphoserine phosphatase)